MLTKYASVEQILEVKQLPERIDYEYGEEAGDRLTRFAATKDHKEQDGYLYVRCRAISSRVNKNNDGWPAEELAKSYKSFIGKPIFVDHNNDDPKRTRGVIVDAQLHVEDAEKASAFDPYYSTAPDNHKPPTWIELLMEVDAKTYPKLADAIRKGDMDAVSMGANIEKSVCSVCANEAATPSEYCNHVKQKGVTFEITSDNGEKVRKKAYEDCYGVGFFEISNVFDPADPTADSWIDDEQKAAKVAKRAEAEGLNSEEVLAYMGLKREGLLAKAASTGKPLTEEVTRKLAESWSDNRVDRNPDLGGPRNLGDLGHPMPPNYEGWDDRDFAVYADNLAKRHLAGEHDVIPHEDCPICGEADPMQSPYYDPTSEHFLGSMDKGAPYPSDSYKNAPDHTPKGQKKWPAEVNAVYNACMRDGKGDKEKCAKIAWAQYDKTKAKGGKLAAAALRYAQLAEQFVKPVDPTGQSADHDKNYEPQSDMTTAPQDVDTLRSEHQCPVCQAADMETDPDGIMRCPTCGHVQEPAPLDNPDLGVARDVELRQDSVDTTSPEGDNAVPAQNPLDGVTFSPVTPAGGTQPMAARKDSTTNEGISEMFTLKLRTSKKEEADALVPVEQKTARAELKLGANGIHRGVYDATREAGLSVKVTYPAIDDEENFVEVPGENGVYNLFYAQESAAKLKVPVTEVPIVIEASSDEDLDKFKTILETAERPSAKQATKTDKKPILPAGSKPSDGPKDANVVSDELAPRETKTVTVSDDVVELDGKKYHLTEISDDSDKKDEPTAEASDAVADASDETAEGGDEAAEGSDEAVDTDDAKALADEVADEDDKESKLLAAFKLADLAVELGLVTTENKMAFIAELEEESMDSLSAREATMKAVKTAGLSKTSPRRVGGVKKLPRLAHAVVASTNGGTLDTTPDEALFL